MTLIWATRFRGTYTTTLPPKSQKKKGKKSSINAAQLLARCSIVDAACFGEVARDANQSTLQNSFPPGLKISIKEGKFPLEVLFVIS